MTGSEPVALPLGDTPNAGWFLTKMPRRVKLFSQPENALYRYQRSDARVFLIPATQLQYDTEIHTKFYRSEGAIIV